VRRGILLGATAATLLWTAANIPGATVSGKELFEKRCTGCHSLDKEKTGPRLRGVYGKAAGSIKSFPYSDALRKSGVTWDSKTLDKWLTGPDDLIPDNDMAFRVRNPEERAALIEYLKSLSPSGL
jgi:cytochrome c